MQMTLTVKAKAKAIVIPRVSFRLHSDKHNSREVVNGR